MCMFLPRALEFDIIQSHNPAHHVIVRLNAPAFEEARNLLQDPQTGKMTAGKNFVAGLLAGATEAVAVVTPMETIKVKVRLLLPI